MPTEKFKHPQIIASSFKKGKAKKGDIIVTYPKSNTAHGYTIETTKGTLWKGLPSNYKLIGKVTKVSNADYQGISAYRLKLERISPNQKGLNIRRNYIMFQIKSTGKIIK